MLNCYNNNYHLLNTCYWPGPAETFHLSFFNSFKSVLYYYYLHVIIIDPEILRSTNMFSKSLKKSESKYHFTDI